MGHQRRQFGVVMVIASVALVATGCGKSTSTTAKTGGCPSGITVGFFGALTGNNSPQLGINEAQGEQLAIAQYNTAHPSCHVNFKSFDSQGEAAQAPALAQKAVTDASLVAIIGPAFSGESKLADPIFNAGGLGTITVSATNPGLSTNGWTIFHRAVATDDAQGPAIARFVSSKLNAKKVAVVDDASAYGKGLADIVRQHLTTAGATVTSPGSIDKSHNYPSTVNAIKAAGVDAVVYGGYYQEAGPLALQLKTAGVTAPFMSGDGSLDKGFIDAATVQGAEGAYFTAPGAYTLTAPEDQAFVKAYTAKWGGPPALYSGEGYDATNHILAAITAGKYSRADINTYISTQSYKGLVKTYSYASNGELNGTAGILVHKVVNGVITLVGPS